MFRGILILGLALGAGADLHLQTQGTTKPASVVPITPAMKSAVPATTATGTTTTGSPIVYGVPTTTQSSSNNSANQQMMQKMMQMMNQGGGAGGAGGTGSGTSGGFPRGYQPNSVNADGSVSAPSGQDGFQYTTPGSVGSCSSDGSLPPKVDVAYKEAQAFRRSCPAANRGDNQMIAINDYSCDGTPTMWIFDANGNCKKKTAITSGAGVGGTGKGPCPQACSTDGEHLTPPGFMLTAYHGEGASGKYGPSNSLLLVGLEGQKSGQRGILIHKAANPGTASSWGCSGVCYTCYDDVAKTLGYGALVYNYFGDPPHTASSCSDTSGASHGTRCEVEGGASFPAGQPQTESSSAQ